MEKVYKIERLHIDAEFLTLKVDGIEYKFRLLEISPRLAESSDEERKDYTLSSSGYGIHWRLIDEDLSIKGLINLK